jgi:hypothetical protein
MNMNAKQRYNARRAAEHREKKQYAGKINRAFAKLSGEASPKVQQALRAPNWREPKEVSGSACLPQVGLFAAGHRKSENITAR